MQCRDRGGDTYKQAKPLIVTGEKPIFTAGPVSRNWSEVQSGAGGNASAKVRQDWRATTIMVGGKHDGLSEEKTLPSTNQFNNKILGHNILG